MTVSWVSLLCKNLPIMHANNIESAQRVTDMQVKPMKQPKQIKSAEQPVVSIDNNVAWGNGSC